MNRFKVGDRVRVIRSDRPERVGVVCTVISEAKPYMNLGEWAGQVPPGTLFHDLDIESPCPPSRVAYPPSHLELYHEPGSWDELAEIWQPLPHKIETLAGSLRETITDIARALTR